jgi:hypothetical protein
VERKAKEGNESEHPFMFPIDGGGQMKILLILTEVKGAGGVETFPQERAWHSNPKSNSITLLPSMSTT